LGRFEEKFAPVIVIRSPTFPEDAESVVMLGGSTTVKFAPALATPVEVVTTTLAVPVATPLGTGTTMVEFNQLVGVAEVVLNLTVP
jgi:hypothetical protein